MKICSILVSESISSLTMRISKRSGTNLAIEPLFVVLVRARGTGLFKKGPIRGADRGLESWYLSWLRVGVVSLARYVVPCVYHYIVDDPTKFFAGRALNLPSTVFRAHVTLNFFNPTSFLSCALCWKAGKREFCFFCSTVLTRQSVLSLGSIFVRNE